MNNIHVEYRIACYQNGNKNLHIVFMFVPNFTAVKQEFKFKMEFSVIIILTLFCKYYYKFVLDRKILTCLI